MTTQQFTFEEHDKLNRKPFADFLFSLIQHRNEYRRPDSTMSYSIAIDAVYGSGKTRFLKMFQSMVQQDSNYHVAYYSAWEHDLYDDALAPILSLLDRPAGVFEDQAYERMEKTLGAKALRVLKRMGTSFLSMKAKKHFGVDYEEIIDDIKALFNEESAVPDAYDLRMKCIDELQNGLKKATEDSPLIFIIDELDRCNPSFAIKTLEVAKHLLDVDNVIFIFALDMHQMRAAVKKFYGQDIDADGYLCKVFDYTTLLPTPPSDEYISLAFARIDQSIEKNAREFFSFATSLLRSHLFSLRLIDSLMTSFAIMWHTFLSDYACEQAYTLYFFALFLKFRYPDKYETLSQSPIMDSDFQETLVDFGHQKDEIRSYVKLCNHRIGTSPKTLWRDGTKKDINDFKVVDEYKIAIINHPITSGCNLSPADSINGLLFFPDLKKYDSIKHLTYGQYIQCQLEMYNPIRAEEPATDTPTT